MLQHTSSCDGRRNSTFWISCFELCWDPAPTARKIDLVVAKKWKVLLKRRAERPNKSTNDELVCDTSEDCQMAKKRKRKYSRAAGTEVKREMHRYKRGKAKSGKGGKAGKVKSSKQAIAIALSKARKKGKKVPKKK